jgi:hypothetical protein
MSYSGGLMSLAFLFLHMLTQLEVSFSYELHDRVPITITMHNPNNSSMEVQWPDLSSSYIHAVTLITVIKPHTSVILNSFNHDIFYIVDENDPFVVVSTVTVQLGETDYTIPISSVSNKFTHHNFNYLSADSISSLLLY